MTLEKIWYLVMKGMDGVFSIMEQCVVQINDSISINLWEVFIGFIVLFFFFKIVIALVNGG